MRPADSSLLRGLLTRRGMLKLGLGVGTLALVLGGGAWRLFHAPARGADRLLLSDGEVEVLDRLAEVYFPAGNVLGVSAADVGVGAAVDRFWSRYLAREQGLLRALLVLLDQWPRASFASSTRFRDLDLAARTRVIAAFEESALHTRQELGTLLRVMVGMPYFEDGRVLRAIGHRKGCLPVLPA